LLTALVTLVVGIVAYAVPDRWNATVVGLVFLAATYALAVSGASSAHVRAMGLSLGGLLETEPVDLRRLIRDTARASIFALCAALLLFPLFWFGFVFWWHPARAFAWSAPLSWSDELFGQALVIALPEEAFYRGYLLTTLERSDRRHLQILGVRVGASLIWSSALFAIGHFVTEPDPARLAVFFPALVFGWLRLRTGGIGSSVLFHVACNTFASLLGRGYGLWH
jgi:membrane protease YdiL (CAAX protease family)